MSRISRRRRASNNRDRFSKVLAADQSRLVEWLRGEREEPLDSEIALSGWLLEVLQPLTAGEEVPAESDTMLLANVICLRLKIGRDVAALSACDSDDVKTRFACQAELMLDSALGTAIQRQTQARVNAFIGSGQMEQSRRWGKLKNELFQSCTCLRELLTQNERQRAAKIMEEPPEKTDRPAQVALTARTSARTTRRARRRRNPAVAALNMLPSRTELLIGTAALLAVIWFGFVRAPDSIRQPVKMITTEDFASVPSIVAVEAYPPSLVLSVDQDGWNAMTLHDTEEMMRQIHFQLTTKGYRGALLRSESGRPLAQWLVETGPRVFEDRAAISASSGLEETRNDG